MLLYDYINSYRGEKLSYLPTNMVYDADTQRLTGQQIKENKTHIHTCVSIISNNFSKLKINIKKDNKIVKNHPLYFKLNHKLNGF